MKPDTITERSTGRIRLRFTAGAASALSCLILLTTLTQSPAKPPIPSQIVWQSVSLDHRAPSTNAAPPVRTIAVTMHAIALAPPGVGSAEPSAGRMSAEDNLKRLMNTSASPPQGGMARHPVLTQPRERDDADESEAGAAGNWITDTAADQLTREDARWGWLAADVFRSRREQDAARTEDQNSAEHFWQDTEATATGASSDRPLDLSPDTYGRSLDLDLFRERTTASQPDTAGAAEALSWDTLLGE